MKFNIKPNILFLEMINSEKIFNNVEKFEIFSSHQPIFDDILNNIETEKKIVIRGDQLSGKSFFCRKILRGIANKLGIHIDRTKIYDYPLFILKKMWQNEIKTFNLAVLKTFLKENNVNEILILDHYDIIILDELNDFLFRDLLKIEYDLDVNQILIQIIDNGLYFHNKGIFQKLNYKVYQLAFPLMEELNDFIKSYDKIFNEQSSLKKVLSQNQFKSIII